MNNRDAAATKRQQDAAERIRQTIKAGANRAPLGDSRQIIRNAAMDTEKVTELLGALRHIRGLATDKTAYSLAPFTLSRIRDICDGVLPK